MRILVDSSNYLVDNDNIGDRAAFGVLAERLIGLWPNARVRFITGNAELIERTHSGLEPVVLRTSDRARDRERHLGEVAAADLVIGAVGGCYSDAFAAQAVGLLDTLEAASELSKPAVMLSAGFETVFDSALLAMARSVLPSLALIACREGAFGPSYVQSLGVPAERVVVTGDDTVELAYAARQPELGDALGLNVRQSTYTGVDDSYLHVLESVVCDAQHRWQAPLVGVPISVYGPLDCASVAKLPESRVALCQTPRHVLNAVGECRVVVTVSYHAAVFALSQGVPVVAITNSRHYRTKLGGLAYQFGPGCVLVALRDECFRDKAADAIDAAWERADALRPRLLARARDQIANSRAAYQRLPALLHASSSPPAGVPSEGALYKRALHAVTAERDALRLVCDERDQVIRSLASTCEVRQLEIDAIAAEARKRDEVIQEQAAALSALRQALVATQNELASQRDAT